jgi:hypothetical protein
MIVIPCKYSDHCPLFSALESIIRFYPDQKIVIVDSDSDDKSYYDRAKKMSSNIIIEDIKNRNYIDGAIWHCFKKYTEENFFYVFQDSIEVLQHLGNLELNDVTIIATFRLQYNEQMYGSSMRAWCMDQIAKTDYDFIEDYEPVFGSCLFIHRHLLDRIAMKGGDKILPTNRLELEGTERTWGMILHQEGYEKIPSLIPLHVWEVNGANPYIKKTYMSYTQYNRP